MLFVQSFSYIVYSITDYRIKKVWNAQKNTTELLDLKKGNLLSIQWNTTQHFKKWTINTYNIGESQNNYVKWKKSDKIKHDCMIPFIQNSRKCKLIHSERKQTSGCLGMGGKWTGRVGEQQEGEITEGKTFGSDGYVHHLDFGDGLRGICILTYVSKFTKLYTWYMFVVYQHSIIQVENTKGGREGNREGKRKGEEEERERVEGKEEEREGERLATRINKPHDTLPSSSLTSTT